MRKLVFKKLYYRNITEIRLGAISSKPSKRGIVLLYLLFSYIKIQIPNKFLFLFVCSLIVFSSVNSLNYNQFRCNSFFKFNTFIIIFVVFLHHRVKVPILYQPNYHRIFCFKNYGFTNFNHNWIYATFIGKKSFLPLSK